MGLNEWMKDNGYTDQKLSDEVGVSRSAITQYRSGARMPRPEIMMKLVAVTDSQVGPIDLMQGLRRGK